MGRAGAIRPVFHMKQDVHIKPITPAAAMELITAANAYMQALYPEMDSGILNLDKFTAPHALFVGAYLGDTLCGTGAVICHGLEYGEVKRIFVPEIWRGRGIARAIMLHLEAHLREQGVARACLETGKLQSAALNLYPQLGYRPCGPIPGSTPDHNSVFFEKFL